MTGIQELNFTGDSAAMAPDTVMATACQFCNANCRLHIGLKANRIVQVRGEADDPVQAGNICIKASLMPQLVYNRFRLTTPLRRVAGEKGSPDSSFKAVS